MIQEHPNDTLNGKLLAWVRPGDEENRHRFGFWHMVEKRMIRAMIEAEGGDPRDTMEISKRLIENHKDDISHKDYQEQVLKPRWAAEARARFDRGETERKASFTKAELVWLVEHLEGTNDPLGGSVLSKVSALLSDSGPSLATPAPGD